MLALAGQRQHERTRRLPAVASSAWAGNSATRASVERRGASGVCVEDLSR